MFGTPKAILVVLFPIDDKLLMLASSSCLIFNRSDIDLRKAYTLM